MYGTNKDKWVISNDEGTEFQELLSLHYALLNLYTVHSPTKALFIKLRKV